MSSKCLAQAILTWLFFRVKLSTAHLESLGYWDAHYFGIPKKPFWTHGCTPFTLGTPLDRTQSPHTPMDSNSFSTSLGLWVYPCTI